MWNDLLFSLFRFRFRNEDSLVNKYGMQEFECLCGWFTHTDGGFRGLLIAMFVCWSHRLEESENDQEPLYFKVKHGFPWFPVGFPLSQH